ncbi:O-antigen ligase family protein [Starkeya koreensis]|uniref:O-antigen ligase family protein n=1 Tax=Ancylobacter koreensis TaxID=266121 RepID=A0ABT0DGL6_9HYPH|nr:O-antigen ligase family protein [Ancylobacter koreensis]MCK0206420.1 O-antigen ligase family protein [Ancylobacter koreensis]
MLFANIVLGGATTAGYLSDVILQFLSVPFLMLGIWLWIDRLSSVARSRAPSPELILGVGMIVVALAIGLAQFVPLFGAPGWAGISRQIVAAGGPPLDAAWTGSSSVDPAASLAALPAVLPPLALFLLVGLLGGEQRLRLIGWAVFFSLLALALGVVQVSQGPQSPLRFFEFGHRVEAVGFFANRNHFSALLYVTLTLGAAWCVARGEGVLAARVPQQRKLVWLVTTFGLLVLLLGGIALARSRAGILLTVLVAGVIVAISPSILTILTGRRGNFRRVRWIAFAAVAGVLLLVGQIGAERFLHRFDDGIVDQIRLKLNARSLELVGDALPTGTGLASFTAVYPAYERLDDLRPGYVNRAHNDWLEFPLEAGAAGILLMVLFLAWFMLRGFRLWLRPPDGAAPVRLLLPRCASLAVLLLLIHSFVDYPLRTATLFAYFALCCALMTPPPGSARVDGQPV